MSILHSCSLLTSALTSSINVNTIQPIEALLNYLLCSQPCLWKLFTHFNSVQLSNSLLFLTTVGASRLDRSFAKFGLGHTPGGADMKGESATHYTRMYSTLKNLWLMKYDHISGIFPCKYTKRYLIFDLLAFSFSSLTALNSPHYCMRRFFSNNCFFFHTFGLHSFGYSF